MGKKYEVSAGWRSISPDLLSTSPESPVHGAAGPRLVVRENPMFEYWDTSREARVRTLGARHPNTTLA